MPDLPILTDVLPDAQPLELNLRESATEVILKADSIVSIQMSHGKYKLVLFRPSKGTRLAVRDVEDEDIDLTLDDRNGLFSPMTPQTIIGSTYEAGIDTLMVDTENRA